MKMSAEYNPGFSTRLLGVGAAVTAVLAMAVAKPAPVSAEAQNVPYNTQCSQRYQPFSEIWRACRGYVNDGQNALWAYYKAGNTLFDGLATHHLDRRFYPPARDEIENRVASWPEGGNEIHQSLELIKLQYNGPDKPTFVETRESWSVTNDDRELMPIAETRSHLVWHTLCFARQRFFKDVPVYKPYKEWLITDNRRNIFSNCKDFARKVLKGQIT